MCGICGIVSLDRTEISAGRVEAMMDRISHRGPDDSGIYISPDSAAALGFRRLSIIDLSTGHQPLANQDRSVWIVFNGEIYNFQTSRDELLKQGHSFNTKTDTEVIVHLYEELGPKCLDRLRGMFAFAIWDENKSALFLARDRVGKKPLYYFCDGRRLIFGSELKCILAELGHEPEIDPAALDQFLAFGYIPAPRTIYRGINKLPPAHYLQFSTQGLKVERYWDISFTPEERPEEEIEKEAERILRESVRLRLISDVPLGALLSGGVDSSVVVALMAQEGGRPPKTFSVGFKEAEYSELEHARKVARHIGAEHHEQIVQPDIIELLNELVDHYDEPFADSSMIPTYLVCRHARQYITVALSGDGGDEVFGGYPRYLYETSIERTLKFPGARLAARGLSALWPDSWRGKLQLKKMRYASGTRYAEQMSFFDSTDRALLFNGNHTNGDGAQDFIQQQYSALYRSNDWESLARLQYLDTMVGYLPGDILTKVDMASMKVSLEARAPLLDHTLIEFMSHVPAKYKIRGTTSKYLLKKIGERLLPRDILYRPKQGFALPLPYWFRNELMPYTKSMLLGDDSRICRMFRREAVARIFHDHTARNLDRSQMLFALLCLELWLRRHRDFAEFDPAASPSRERLALRHAT